MLAYTKAICEFIISYEKLYDAKDTKSLYKASRKARKKIIQIFTFIVSSLVVMVIYRATMCALHLNKNSGGAKTYKMITKIKHGL